MPSTVILEAPTAEGWLLGVVERLQDLSYFSKNDSMEGEWASTRAEEQGPKAL